MITDPTVLILGAGASADYGFPIGRQLLLDICRDASPGGQLFDLLGRRMEFPQGEIDRFREALQNSQAPSVDLFLENRKDFEEIGKLAIAATLIPYENYEAFLPIEKPRWYETLFGLMVQGGRFEENRLSVITFNYDRSLEAFLFLALQNLHGLKPEDAEDRLRKIQIVHLYGALGDKLSPVDLERGYQPKLQGNWVTVAAQRIKIVHEAQPGKEFEVAQKLLREAEEVVFLGFGFHPVNVQRLRLQELREWQEHTNHKCARWLACRTGMGDGDIARAKIYLQALPEVSFAPASNWGINDFLKNTQCLKPTG